MKYPRLACACAILLMLGVCAGATTLYRGAHSTQQYNSYALPLAPAPREENPLAAIDPATFIVDSSFTSHLPVVVLDTAGVEPPVNLTFVRNVFVPIEGLDPYVDGTMAVYDALEGGNSPFGQQPDATSTIRIKRRGNSSMLSPKAQWLIKLTTASGQNNDLNLLGMGEEHEWVLGGSLADKSMLRNYLAYSSASQFLPYTPDSRYCEVLTKTEAGYRYEGVFTLCENIRQGEHRVAVQAYQPANTFNSYIVRRDRYDSDSNMLGTYGQQHGYAKEYMGLLYPSQFSVTPQMTRYVEADISAIERVLYSNDDAVFSRYPDVIDVDSFVDYFLFNEFFISYDAGNYSTYMYKDVGGKLCMGPVWDLDGAMDNYIFEPAETDTLAFQTKPWFDQLCADKQFVRKLEARYAQLSRGALSIQSTINKVDEIANALGGAQQREWLRWKASYTQENKLLSLADFVTEDGLTLHRNPDTYQQELYRLKTALREHARELPALLAGLHKTATRDTGATVWMGLLLALSLCTVFVPAIVVAYRK